MKLLGELVQEHRAKSAVATKSAQLLGYLNDSGAKDVKIDDVGTTGRASVQFSWENKSLRITVTREGFIFNGKPYVFEKLIPAVAEFLA